MALTTVHKKQDSSSACHEYRISPRHCKRCGCEKIIEDRGERCCTRCGLCQGQVFDFDTYMANMPSNSPSYKRNFYFNERCTRWTCTEPPLPPDVLALVKNEAMDRDKYGDLQLGCSRGVISRILRAVGSKLTPAFMEKYRSVKFKKQAMTPKRFYDKYYEKWKTIRWSLNGQKPIIPSRRLVERIKFLFAASQKPFEDFRHTEKCTRCMNCEEKFKCWHNFRSYDYAFRIYLQICEQRYGFKNCYTLFKDEFPLVSDKLVKTKLRPLFMKICAYNEWDMPKND